MAVSFPLPAAFRTRALRIVARGATPFTTTPFAADSPATCDPCPFGSSIRGSAVTKFVRVGGFVNATPDFKEHPKVVNGASDLFVEVFGDAGRHARVAVGYASLPFNIAVEIEAVVEV